ncbi:MAG TPA: transglutaminase family protein [Rubrivivax sp.]|nr:transglutaminase family protein [Rubrivivax sp.]
MKNKTKAAAGEPFSVDCKLHYVLPATTDFVFQIHALDGMDQSVESESLRITPPSARRRVFEDPYVNQRFLRVQSDAGPFKLHYKAHVRVNRQPANKRAKEVPVAELPDEVLHHLMPTRYCESDLLAPATLKLFGQLKPGWSRVQAICDWIQRNVEYKPGSSNSTTTACDVFLQRAGVCRDFAHLGVTFCRALNIPARLAVGYSIFDSPPPDFHAMFEAYVGGRWQLFDPTQMSLPEEMVRIAVGRDAKDVAFSTIFGAVQCKLILPRIQRG